MSQALLPGSLTNLGFFVKYPCNNKNLHDCVHKKREHYNQWRSQGGGSGCSSPPIGSRFSIYICRTHLSQRINLWRRQAI